MKKINNTIRMAFAYVPCDNDKPTINAVPDCDSPAFAGLKELAVGFPKSSITNLVRGTAAAKTKNYVSALTATDVFVVEAKGEIPWQDTGITANTDTKDFTKTAHFIAPTHGSGFDAEFTEALLKNRDGFVFVLQRQHENGDWSFPIVGLEKGAIMSDGTLNMTDTATAGCWGITMTESNVPSGEICLWSESFEATKAIFDALVAASFNPVDPTAPVLSTLTYGGTNIISETSVKATSGTVLSGTGNNLASGALQLRFSALNIWQDATDAAPGYTVTDNSLSLVVDEDIISDGSDLTGIRVGDTEIWPKTSYIINPGTQDPNPVDPYPSGNPIITAIAVNGTSIIDRAEPFAQNEPQTITGEGSNIDYGPIKIKLQSNATRYEATANANYFKLISQTPTSFEVSQIKVIGSGGYMIEKIFIGDVQIWPR